jgi:WhiB family redox-sensing transcriptional regulator
MPDISWHEQAACAGLDTNMFYYANLERGPAKMLRIQMAKAVCNTCPVKTKCLANALEHQDNHSIQGGTTPEERGYSPHKTIHPKELQSA